jgi:Copper amine oxidase N-terminal domain.
MGISGKVIKRIAIMGAISAVVLANQPSGRSYAADVSPTILINGQLLKSDKKALIIDGTTYVPLRAIAENFQAEVIWRGQASRDVVILKDGNVIQLSSKYALNKANINGEERYIEANPKLIDNTTMIPLRMIGGLLNLKVAWENKTSTVRLEQKESKVVNLNNQKGYVISASQTTIEILTPELRIVDVDAVYPESEYTKKIDNYNAEIKANLSNEKKVEELLDQRREVSSEYDKFLRNYDGTEVTFNLQWNHDWNQLEAKDMVFSDLSANAEYEKVNLTAVPERILYWTGGANVFQLKSLTDGSSVSVLNTFNTEAKVTNLVPDSNPEIQAILENRPFRAVGARAMNNELFTYKLEVEGLRNKSTGLVVATNMHYIEQPQPYNSLYNGELLFTVDKRIVNEPTRQVYTGHFLINVDNPQVEIEFKKGITENFTLNNLAGSSLLVSTEQDKVKNWSFDFQNVYLANGKVSKIVAQTDEEVTFEIIPNETTVKFVTVNLSKLNGHPADYFVGKKIAASGAPKGLENLEVIWFSLFE